MKPQLLFFLVLGALLEAACESDSIGGNSSSSGNPSGQVSRKPIKSITQTYTLSLGEGLRSMAGKVSVEYIGEDGETSKEVITGSTWTKKTAVSVPGTKVNLDNNASGISVTCEPGTVPSGNTYQVDYESSCVYEITYEDGSSRIVPLWNIAPEIPDVEGRDAAETCQAVNLSCTVDKEIVADDRGAVYIQESGFWESESIQDSPVATRVVEEADEPEAVDLGFTCNDRPLLWATRNVGARSTGDFGGLYGWGDPTGFHTETDLHYYPSRHPADFVGKHANSISGTRCDLAYCQWGSQWRIPSKEEWAALVANCNWSKATVDGNTGMRFTSKINGKSIFLPAADMRYGNNLYRESTSPENRHGYYWAGEWEPGDAQLAYSFYFTLFSTGTPDSKAKANKQRSYGMSIRPVTQQTPEPMPVIIN